MTGRVASDGAERVELQDAGSPPIKTSAPNHVLVTTTPTLEGATRVPRGTGHHRPLGERTLGQNYPGMVRDESTIYLHMLGRSASTVTPAWIATETKLPTLLPS